MIEGIEYIYLLGVVIDSKRSTLKQITYKANRIEAYHAEILGYCLYDYKKQYTKYITRKAFIAFIKAKEDYITPLGGDFYFNSYLNNWKCLSGIDCLYVGKSDTDTCKSNCFYYDCNGKIAFIEGFDGLIFDINSGYIDIGVENVVLSLDNLSYIELNARSMKTKDCISFSMFDKHIIAKDKNVMEMYDDHIVFCKDLAYDLEDFNTLYVTDEVVGKYCVEKASGTIKVPSDIRNAIIDFKDSNALSFEVIVPKTVRAVSIKPCSGIEKLIIHVDYYTKYHKYLYDIVYELLLRYITLDLDIDMKQASKTIIEEYFKIKDDIDQLYKSGMYADIFKYKIGENTFYVKLSRAIMDDVKLKEGLTQLAKDNNSPYCWDICVAIY